MKQMMAIVAGAAVMCMAYAANAGISGATIDGESATNYVNYGRGGAAKNGLEGTITAVGTRGFLLTVSEKQVLRIVVDANTKFMQGGKQVDPSSIKQGLKVGVTGSTLAQDEMQASVVVIEGEAPKKK